jgi:hypothetical protein
VIHRDPELVEVFDGIVTKLYADLTPDDEDCKAHALLPDLAELNHL